MQIKLSVNTHLILNWKQGHEQTYNICQYINQDPIAWQLPFPTDSINSFNKSDNPLYKMSTELSDEAPSFHVSYLIFYTFKSQIILKPITHDFQNGCSYKANVVFSLAIN